MQCYLFKSERERYSSLITLHYLELLSEYEVEV